VDSAWHIIRWIWFAAIVVCLATQLVAARRAGWRSRSRRWAVNVTMICALLPSLVSDIFENREASRVVALVGAAVVVAVTAVFVRTMLQRSGIGSVGDDGDRIEDRTQRLGLG
jgi:hypothetical protein